MEAVRLSVSNLNKAYSTPVLKHMSLSVLRGEVHAIVGENGAGKSTLANILAGNLVEDSGVISLDGRPYKPVSPRDAIEAGVSVAAQELTIIDTLSVAENIALRHLPHRNFVILRSPLEQMARRLLRLVGLDGMPPDVHASELSIAERQLLELAKAVATDCRLLILDEPTSALAGPQAERVHQIIADLTANGTSVIYISHRLDDVLRISNTVSILRDGEIVISAPADSMTVADMMEHMSGRSAQRAGTRDVTARADTPVLEADHVTTDHLPHPISLSCYRGEIVGIAGLAGSGRSELLQALFGLAPLTGGEVRRCRRTGKTAIQNASQAVREGIGFLGEDRQSMGVFAGQSILTNIMIPGDSVGVSGLRLVDRNGELAAGRELVGKLAIRCAGLDQDIAQLSGGNQQKTLIARWLRCDSDVLLLDEPTRGVDVATKGAIYELLFELQDRHKAMVVTSSELEELMALCGRILVLSGRKPVRIFERGDWSETALLAAAFDELVDAPGTAA